ncbi:MAG: helix-turn-helix domain-containing protein [Ilumatobacteraceae bacterium]
MSADLPLAIRQMLTPLAEALGCTLIAGDHLEAADIPLVLDGQVVGGVRLPALHGALDRMIEAVEREVGCRLAVMTREQKQQAIRSLDDRGAFTLRRAVEDVADAMAVSRITVYNYLNAIHR